MTTGEHETETPDVPAEGLEAEEAAKQRLDLDVQITDVGPCKKHLKVAIGRTDIDRQFEDSLGELKREAFVPGFRPGRAPAQLVERRFRKQMGDQVKASLLTAALTQIDEDYKLNPITQPHLDVESIELPADGPMLFEMDVEVRPEFELPKYKELKVNRPVKTLTEADVDAQLKLYLERHAQLVPKLEGGAALGDYLTADLRFHRGDQTYNEAKEVTFRLQSELRFQDGSVPNVDAVLLGVKAGESREAEAKIGTSSPDPTLRGQSIAMTFQVNDLKELRFPEIDRAFLDRIGFDSIEELRDALEDVIQRRFLMQQRQAIRTEVMSELIRSTPFDLPADLVSNQEKATLRRIVAQMKQEGSSESEIRAREAELRANAHETTLRSLKEFFILAKIAEAEGITVEDEDIDLEIEAIAERTDESPRRIRARIEKDNLLDALASDILERKTLDRILDQVETVDVPLEAPKEVETIDQTVSSASEPSTPEGDGGSPDATEADSASS